MSFQDEIQKLINYTEENLRTTDETKAEFIDPRNYTARLYNKQNQVIFGRRGSGKSLLMKTLDTKSNDFIYLKSNLEDYKDTSFPNSILHVVVKFLKNLKPILREHTTWYQFGKRKKLKKLLKRIDNKLADYSIQIKVPDSYDEKIREKDSGQIGGEIEANKGFAKAKLSTSIAAEKESQKSLLRNKADLIKNEIPDLKEILIDAAELLNDKAIYLGLDDFYFIRKSEQPFFIDFFHRLTKDTKLYLKVATIRYRSKLYTTTGESYVGTELGHDIVEIDLDYTLDRYDLMQNFMRELLNEAIKNSTAQIEISRLFSENGFKQLCLASGGVPRDFLSLTLKLASSYVSESNTISKIDVTEVAISNFTNKSDAYAKDSAEEKEVLDLYLSYLKDFLFNTKRTNMFLVSNQDVENYPQINQAIKELMDLRMIHLVEPIISCAPSDGKKYAAYMLDIGLYTNSKPRNFTQIEPGASDDKSRKDQIRSAPRINLDELKANIENESPQLELDLTKN
ncbi:MAG TPA: hypothetical protein PLT28_10035 [Saprospiraceae bacterium]|nr:hypothetical protein [Saprospiraceae bacterium]